MHVERHGPEAKHQKRTSRSGALALGWVAIVFAQACFQVGDTPKTEDTGPSVAGPHIVLSTDVVDFGAQGLGTTGSQDLVIDNAGTSELTLSSFELQSSGMVFTLPPSLPLGIMAGNTAYITLRFTPEEMGPVEAQLIVHSNDPDTPAAEVLLKGRGVAGDTGAD
jgi:hypothetical protein